MTFFGRQGRRRIETEYWAFDITTISSYSSVLKQVKNGVNKEHDRLPQINLALLFGEQSGCRSTIASCPAILPTSRRLSS